MTMTSNSRAVAKNFLSLILLSVNTLAFADGPFDPTFSGDGLFPYSYWFGGDIAQASGIARDSSGRLIVATSVVTYPDTSRDGLAATRHIAADSKTSLFPFADGAPDGTFGTNGIASDFLGSDIYSYSTAIAVDHHDRIILAGGMYNRSICLDGTTEDIDAEVLVRLRDDTGFDGQADAKFGAFGVASYGDCSHYTNGIAGLAVDKDDNIVATGSTAQGPRSHQANIIRWTSSGQLDGSFGDAGAIGAAFMGDDTIGTSVAIDSAGRILTTAEATTDDRTVLGLLMRFTLDGKLDTTFGSAGYVQLGTIGEDSLGYLGHVCCIGIDSHNRAIVAGYIVAPSPLDTESSEESAFVARFTDKGTPDETFGMHGFVFPSSDQMTEADALAIDKDRPVVGGNIRSSYFPGAVTVLSHFNLDGSLNKSVGFGGIYTAAFGFSGSYVTSMLIDAFGRPTLTAFGEDSDSREVPVLIRYDEMFGDGFD